MYILLAILIFGFLILIHELGHFIAARICGVTVLEFAIGMGPKIFSIKSKKSGTAYSLRLFPLGGFVSMLGETGMEAVQGENGEKSDTEVDNSIFVNDASKENTPDVQEDNANTSPEREMNDVADEPDPHAYSSQNVWKRMFISLAGPFMNVFMGFVLMFVFVFSSALSNPLGTNEVGAFFVTYKGEQHQSFATGDYLSKIAETGTQASEQQLVAVQSYSQLLEMVKKSTTNTFTVEVMRVVTESDVQSVKRITLTNVYLDESILEAQFDYSRSEQSGLKVDDQIIKVNKTPVHTQNELAYEVMNQGYKPMTLTVIRNGEKVVLENVVVRTFTDSGVTFGDVDFRVWAEPVEEGKSAPSFGILMKHVWFRSLSTVKMVYDSLGGLFSGRYGVEAVSGPVGITQTISDVAKTGFLNVLYLVVIISINLGIMNLLPIPGLDGGHMLIYVIEVVRGKPMKKEVESIITAIGLLAMIGLAILIAIKDIINL